MSEKITFAENKKVLDFEKSTKGKLNEYMAERINLEKSEYSTFRYLGIEEAHDAGDPLDGSDADYDNDFSDDDFDDGSSEEEYVLSPEEEAELLKEFEAELGDDD
jgi:hypothetical protein